MRMTSSGPQAYTESLTTRYISMKTNLIFCIIVAADAHTTLGSQLSAGHRPNIKTVFQRYGDFHVKDKTVG